MSKFERPEKVVLKLLLSAKHVLIADIHSINKMNVYKNPLNKNMPGGENVIVSGSNMTMNIQR